MYERAFAGVVASWIRFGVTTLVGLVQIPILYRHLPPTELGVWFLFFTIAIFINLSDLGIPSVFSRSVSYIWGRGQAEVEVLPPAGAPYYHNVPVHDLYRSALVATLIVGVAVSLAGYPLAHLYISSITNDPFLLEKLAWALACFLVGVVLNLAAAIPNACLSGYGDVGWDNAVRTAANLFGFLLLLWLVPIYKDIRVLSMIYLAQGIFAFLAGHFTLSRLHRGSISAVGRVRFSAISGMYRESAPVFVTRLGLWMIAESTLLLAGYFLGPAKIPDFAILRQIVTMGMTVATAIPIALAPYAAAAHAAMDPARANLIYRKSLRYTMVVTVLWTVGLLLWTPRVIGLWVGPGHFLGYGVLVPIVITCFLELHGTAHGFFVWSAGKWPFAPVAVLAGVLNILLAGFGCSRFGYEGLVWGSLLSQAVSSHWYGVYYALKLLGLPARQYFREIVRPTALYMLLLMAAAVAVKYSMDWGIDILVFPSSVWTLLGCVAAAVLLTTIIAAGFAWLLVLENDDRADVLRLLKWRR